MDILPFPVSHGTDTTHENVYLAAPLSTFATPRYDAALALIRERHPHARILSPRDAFKSNADWLEQWPSIRPTITALYLLTGDGSYYDYIAAGCLKEWWDVTGDDGKPCILIDRRMTVHERFRIADLDTYGPRWQVYPGPSHPLYGRSKKPRQPVTLRPRPRPYDPPCRPSALDEWGL